MKGEPLSTRPSPPAPDAGVSFADRLCQAVKAKQTPAMVGIDPRWDLLPPEMRERAITTCGRTPQAVAEAYLDFCRQIIDCVANRVAIVKFQAAFFEAAGPSGLQVLAELMAHAQAAGLLVVLDGKRNDIGSTAAAYSQAYLGELTIDDTTHRPWCADALTVNPFLGAEGIEPFLETANAHGGGLFILVRTSNPGAGRLQDLSVGKRTVYQTIADWVQTWSSDSLGTCGYGPAGAVVGATVPDQVAELRERMPNVLMLLPGYGAQGGSSADTAAAFDEDGLGAVVNNSRGILYAYQRPEFAELSWQQASDKTLLEMIDDLARHTPAGNLRK